MQRDDRIDGLGLNYNEPMHCDKCGSRKLKYNGVGEYECENCAFLMYDDYGRVRNYIEVNPGANQAEVSAATGVSQAMIRKLLRDERIQIAPGSASYLHCERCGIAIRSGRYCEDCAKDIAKSKSDAEARKSSASKIQGGFGKSVQGASGEKRFKR